MTTGEKIAALRRDARLSQEALADQLGISRQAVSKWEADQAVPTMDNLMELSRIFGVSVDALLRPDGVLSGKEEPPAAEGGKNEPEITLSPSGYTVSYRPELTRKTKWFIIALAALLCACVLCNVISLVWLNRLQDQADDLQQQIYSLPRGGGTVYVPSSGVAENNDIADYSVTYQPDTAGLDMIRLMLSAMPREVDAEENAQFSIRFGNEGQAVDAVYENGYYTAQMLVPMTDETISVYLLLSKDGATRNLLVDSIYSLKEQFSFLIEPMWNQGEQIGYKSNSGGYAQGELAIDVASNCGVLGSRGFYPVSGKVTLLLNDQEYDSVPISDIAERTSEWTDLEDGEYHVNSIYRVTLPWTGIQMSLEDELKLRIDITDNFGKVHSVFM